MHQVIITYDKYAGSYEVSVKERKQIFGFQYWSLIARYRGPLTWTCNKAITMSAQYGVEVTDKTDKKLNLS